MEIRVVRPADADGIAEVHARTWQAAYRGDIPDEVLDRQTEPDALQRRSQHWREGIEAGRVADHLGWWDVRVVTEEDRIVGFAAAGPEREEDAPEDAGELYAIYVLPEWWGSGAGHRLIDAVIDRFRDRGMRTAYLWVLETNDRARAFYERHGWEPTGQTRTEELAGVEVEEVRYGRSL